MSEVTAASLLAVIGVFDLVGTLCSGWLTDRFDPRRLLFWYYGLRGLSLLALPFVIGSSNLGLIAFVVFYGLDWVATVPPTVAITAQSVRTRARRRRLRLDLRRPPARRSRRRLGRRRGADVVRRLPGRVRHRRACSRLLASGLVDPDRVRALGSRLGRA